MSTSDLVRERARQSRERLISLDVLRAEHRLIQDHSARCLASSRALLDASAARCRRPPAR